MIIAKPLRILTRKRNDRSPDVALVVRYFIHCSLHHRDLSVCIPKPMFVKFFHSGTVCNIANEILTLIEVERIYFLCLLYEF